MTQQQVFTGALTAWLEKRSFGFITASMGGAEIFVHLSDIVGGLPLPIATHVQFELVQFNGKTKATRVEPVVPAGGSND